MFRAGKGKIVPKRIKEQLTCENAIKVIGVLLDTAWGYVLLYIFLAGIVSVLSASGYQWLDQLADEVAASAVPVSLEEVNTAAHRVLSTITCGLLMPYYVICNINNEKTAILQTCALFVYYEIMVRLVRTLSITPLAAVAAMCLIYYGFAMFRERKGKEDVRLDEHNEEENSFQ